VTGRAAEGHDPDQREGALLLRALALCPSFFSSIAAISAVTDKALDDLVAQINSETVRDRRTTLSGQYADLPNLRGLVPAAPLVSSLPSPGPTRLRDDRALAVRRLAVVAESEVGAS
jgi:hypothetical protein